MWIMNCRTWIFSFLCYAFCLLVLCGSADGVATTPAAGWCRAKHTPAKAAQSGFDGYCKSCYKEKHPKKYAAKVSGRKVKCKFCSKLRESGGGNLCKPCMRARSCESCAASNLAKSSAICSRCHAFRASLGAAQSRLAMWCVTCTSAVERATALCRSCYTSLSGACYHCEKLLIYRRLLPV